MLKKHGAGPQQIGVRQPQSGDLRPQQVGHPCRFSLGLGLFGMIVDEPCQPAHGRVALFAAESDLLPIEAFVVVVAGGNHRVVIGMISLDDHLPAQRADGPARPATWVSS